MRGSSRSTSVLENSHDLHAGRTFCGSVFCQPASPKHATYLKLGRRRRLRQKKHVFAPPPDIPPAHKIQQTSGQRVTPLWLRRYGRCAWHDVCRLLGCRCIYESVGIIRCECTRAPEIRHQRRNFQYSFQSLAKVDGVQTPCLADCPRDCGAAAEVQCVEPQGRSWCYSPLLHCVQVRRVNHTSPCGEMAVEITCRDNGVTTLQPGFLTRTLEICPQCMDYTPFSTKADHYYQGQVSCTTVYGPIKRANTK